MTAGRTYVEARAYEVGLPFRSVGELVLWLDPLADHAAQAGIGVEMGGRYYAAAYVKNLMLVTIEKRLHEMKRAWRA